MADCRRAGDHPVCTIAPPYLLKKYAESGDPEQRAAAARTLASLSVLRERRAFMATLIAHPDVDVKALGLAPGGTESTVSVYDAHGLPFTSSRLPGELRRGDGDPPVGDEAVNQAHDAAKTTIEFYTTAMQRNGIDGAGMEVVSSVHVTDQLGQPWENAAWDSRQMVYGDGGRMFKRGSLTTALDVIGHELTHGVTQYTAALDYNGQPGALNESMSDVFGSMVKQHKLGQTSADADWLIGAGLLRDARAKALRSMSNPGTAGPDDPQPASMDDFQELPDDEDGDWGGVHINSGIPNRAFYLAATALGGHSWERAGKVWYAALTTRLKHDSEFSDAAQATMDAAEELFPGGEVRGQVEQAWRTVGVIG
jgi:Zn-dependent metalloprotease